MEGMFECKVRAKIKVGLPLMMNVIKQQVEELIKINFNEFIDIYVDDVKISDWEFKIDIERPVKN